MVPRLNMEATAMGSYQHVSLGSGRPLPWHKGSLMGPKPPLKLREIWAVRIRLQMRKRTLDLAMFNLALDGTLRGCDLINLGVQDVAHSGEPVTRASIVPQKTRQPVEFGLTEQTQNAVETWIGEADCQLGSICSRADRPGCPIFPPASTREP
ncbi:MAG: hypothetical protein P8180_12820 [Gammaproteobacteria bacterium]